MLLGAIALTDSEFSEGSKPETVHDLQCNGTELEVLNCHYVLQGNESCGQFEDAGVVCQG